MATALPDIKNLPKHIQREAQTFRDKHSEIKQNVGKFVLVHRDSVVNYFDSYGQAATKGYKLFGLDDFLVKEVRLNETPLRAMRCGVIKTDGKLRVTRGRTR